MSWDSLLYKIEFGNSFVASTKVDGIGPLLESHVPGCYAIDEVTTSGGLLSKTQTRRWGWAVKDKNGRVVLMSDDAAASAAERAEFVHCDTNRGRLDRIRELHSPAPCRGGDVESAGGWV